MTSPPQNRRKSRWRKAPKARPVLAGGSSGDVLVATSWRSEDGARPQGRMPLGRADCPYHKGNSEDHGTRIGQTHRNSAVVGAERPCVNQYWVAPRHLHQEEAARPLT